MSERRREKDTRLPLTLSNVYAGRVFSSYREMCKELGLKIKTGEAKINQMRDLNKVLKISTEGYKIRIEEIRDREELKEIERREGEERLERDCEAGRGVFGDRKILFMRMVWKRMMEGKEIPSKVSLGRDEKQTLVFFPEEVISYLNLAQDNFQEERLAAREHNISDLLWSFNEIAAQNKRVLKTLFNNLFASSLVVGYKTFRLSMDWGEDIICNAEDALLVTEVIEHLLDEMECRNIYEVHLKGKENEYYLELRKRLKKKYRIDYFEECYVVITSEFLLSRFMIKNFSKVNQKLILTKQSNECNIKSLGKRITREMGTMYLEADGHEKNGEEEKAVELRKKANLRELVFNTTVEAVVNTTGERETI